MTSSRKTSCWTNTVSASSVPLRDSTRRLTGGMPAVVRALHLPHRQRQARRLWAGGRVFQGRRGAQAQPNVWVPAVHCPGNHRHLRRARRRRLVVRHHPICPAGGQYVGCRRCIPPPPLLPRTASPRCCAADPVDREACSAWRAQIRRGTSPPWSTPTLSRTPKGWRRRCGGKYRIASCVRVAS